MRLDRQYQGWGEIAAFHVDRVLGLYRVPPITSRYLSSKIYYKHDESWMGRVLLGLPEHQVPVSVHAWLEDVKPAPPFLRLGTPRHAATPRHARTAVTDQERVRTRRRVLARQGSDSRLGARKRSRVQHRVGVRLSGRWFAWRVCIRILARSRS